MADAARARRNRGPRPIVCTGTNALDTEGGAYTVRDIGGGNVSLPVSSTVEATVVSCDAGCTEGTPITYATLTLSTDDGAAYWITVDDGAVARIDQQYLA